jgi:hypothetical protein
MFAYLLVCAVSSLPIQQDALATETLKLQNVKPSRILRVLKTQTSETSDGRKIRLIPVGIKSITPSDSTMYLILFGTEKARAEVRQIVPLLDVRPSEAQVVLRVVRETFVQGKSTGKETVLVHQLKCINNMPMEIASKDEDGGFNMEFTARINGDKSVSLTGMSDINYDEARRNGLTFRRRMAAGQTSILTGVTNSADGAIQDRIGQGENAPQPGTYYVYYLEAEVLPDSVHLGSEIRRAVK